MNREQVLEAALREIKDIPNMRDENNQRIAQARAIAERVLGERATTIRRDGPIVIEATNCNAKEGK